MRTQGRLRVLVATVWFPTRERPHAHTFVQRQCQAAALYDDVFVVHLNDDASSAQDAGEPPNVGTAGLRSIEATPASWPRLPGSAPFHRLRALAAGMRTARDVGFVPDLVHAHMVEAALPAAAVARRHRLPVVVTEHFSGFRTGGASTGQILKARLAMRLAHQVLPVSDAMRRDLEDRGIRANYTVVPNAVDLAEFHPASAPTKQSHSEAELLFVGRLEPVKGADVLLDALALLPRGSSWRLRVVGDGSQRAALEQAAERLGFVDRVRFDGFQPPSSVSEAMRQADLLVIPSRYETFGATAIEAAASGLPVLATGVGGLVSVVRPEIGRLAEPSAAAIAQRLSSFLEGDWPYDPDAAVATARHTWSLESVGRQLHGIYLSATGLA